MDLVLQGAEGEVDESPCYNAGAAVGEELEVEGAGQARVEFDAHV